ncbi:nicotinamide N-methyltransferase-like [Dysidea avara]|uniref:nicotinamide N-methyltransferase-like n=1 Tax=Dysidea avara TaxID=196820 RepID=UPI003331ABDF
MSTVQISYLTDFDGREYVKSFYNAVDGNPQEKGFTLLYRTQVIEFYKRYNSKWDNNTARLLEFSGGASIVGLISAVPYVNQIIFSAHTESERKEVELWKFEKDGAHDWSDHFKFAVNELENITGNAARQDREKLLRQRITAIIGCDIFQDYPLSIKQDPFEIISASLCLEVACSTYLEYKAAVKKLVTLLKPGGFLTMFVVERETFYMVGEKRWPCFPVTLEQVKEALADAGMVVLVAERDPAPIHDIENPIISDYKAVVFVAAQRVVF